MTQPYPEERRLATVLFADIQGFTALADKLDFEEVTDLVKEIWLRVDAIIEAHGGYIDKHIGDAVMAVWGAPRAGEGDAEQAVAAALALQASLAEYVAQSPREDVTGLKMRVGLNTGPVLAGYVGARNEYTVMGDTVNVASRLEQIAEAGAVVISESTYRLVRGAFRLRRLGPVLVKGKTGPLPIFEVEGPITQAGRVRYRGAGGLETRMVAREFELGRLIELYRKTVGQQSPTLALVRGEAGLGKSRLLMEFTSQLEIDEPDINLLSARGLPETSRVPFFLWKSVWHNRFSLKDNDPPEAARAKLLRGMQALWGHQLGPAPASEAAHLVGGLIGLEWPDSPHLAVWQDNVEGQVKRAFELTRELLRRLCAAGPTVLLLDDLQWVDGGSLDLLAELIKPAYDPMPLFVLGGVRPGLLRHHSELAEAAELILLAPLPVSGQVVAAAYPSLRYLPESILTDLAHRAEGNPYFLEEMVKSLVAAKPAGNGGAAREAAVDIVERVKANIELGHGGRLPDSLRAVLQARLDALSPEARGVALLASVVGRVFWAGAVMAAARQLAGTGLLKLPAPDSDQVITKGLAELVQAEMAFPRVGSVFAGEQEYIFKHTLLRDVAYGLLPHKYRRQYHLAVARWLGAYAGPDFAATVADHLELAGDYKEAAQQYQKAARYAQSRGAAVEAGWLQTRARKLLARPPGSGLLGSH
jgi:class 3 adenylate cyclase